MEFSAAVIVESEGVERPPLWKRIFNPHRILVFFSLINFLVYFDRGAVAGLLSVIGDEYELDEISNGILSGAFMVGYVLFYIIFNFVSSTNNIPLLLFLGLLSWSIGTFGTVLSSDFQIFVLMRTLTGAAEASYAGVAAVYLDDNCPPDSRFLWLSLYYVAIPIGAAIGTAVAGFVEDVWEWEYVFAIEGLVMFPLAFLCFAIPASWLQEYGQSSRTAVEKGINFDVMDAPLMPNTTSDHTEIGFWNLVQILRDNKIYWNLIMGKTTYIFYAGAFLFWGPYYIQEEYDLSIREANFVFGMTTMFSGLMGAWIGGYYLDSLSSKNMSNWTKCIISVRLCCVLVALSIPVSIGLYFAPNKVAVLVALTVSEFLIFAMIGSMHGCTISSLPVWLRPFGMGFSICICHLLGDFPAALVIGYLSEISGNLQACLAVASLVNVGSVIFWYRAMNHAKAPRRMYQETFAFQSDRYMTHG